MPTMTGWNAAIAGPFLLLMLIPVVRAVKQALSRPWGIGIIAVSLHALVDFPFQVYSILLLFFLMLAALEVTPPLLAYGRRRPASDIAAVCQTP